MKTYTTRQFLSLLANGAAIETMEKRNALAKTYLLGADDKAEVKKEAAEAVRAIRLENNISEGDVMKALGLSDVNQYVAWENGQATIELSPENFTALAKVLKTDIATLAAKMISADGPDPQLDADPAATAANNAVNGMSGGDQGAPPGQDASDKSVSGAATGNRVQKDRGASGQAAIHPVQVIKMNDVLDSANMSDPAARAAIAKRLAKALLFGGMETSKVAKIEKAGLITPEDFAPNSTLNPQLGTDLVNVVVDQREFLQKIQHKPVARQSAEILVADISARKAQRQGPGWPDSSIMSKTVNKSLQVSCTKRNYYLTIDDRTLINYQGNLPGLETEILNMFSVQFGNDTLDLGFNGNADTGNNVETVFTNLNKGWMYLAQNGNGKYTVPSGQLLTASTDDAMYDNGNHATGNFTQTLMYGELINQAIYTTPRFFTDDTPLVTGSFDWRKHANALANRTYDVLKAIIDGVEKKFEGHPVEAINYITSQNLLFTQYQNFVWAVVTGTQGTDGITIERHRVPQATLFVFTIYDDFEFVNYDAIACVKPS